jgi:hypothetical protein
MSTYGFGKKWMLAGPLLVLVVLSTVGCATSPYYYDRVASSSLGMGALGTAIGFAATGDPRWAAVGGLSGLAAGALAGAAAEESRARAYADAPPPPYRSERCRLVHTVVRENGMVVREYDREVCVDPPYYYRHHYYPY